jgi:hypothetical protein
MHKMYRMSCDLDPADIELLEQRLLSVGLKGMDFANQQEQHHDQ